MHLPFDESWTWELKNQYFQERFADKLLKTTCRYSNVIYELVNEGSNRSAYDEHWIYFFKKRCENVIVINDDYTPLDARHHAKVDAISWHTHTVDPYSLNARWVIGFNTMPPKPTINSETIPDFYGDLIMVHNFRKLVWSIAMAGGHVFVQDDTVLGFDPNALQKPGGNMLRKHIGYANFFFNDSGFDIGQMSPHNEIVKSGKAFAMASIGKEYILYIPDRNQIVVDMSAIEGSMEFQWFNPCTGRFSEIVTMKSSPSVSFPPPLSDDAALHIRATKGT